MNESSPQGKPASGRRRNNRHANKAYLSESDMPAAPYGYGYGETDGPQTPQKPTTGSPPPQAHGHASGQRTKSNRGRPKNVTISPESAKHDRQTPPLTASGAKSSTAAAFAGATFHASPAPSALPIPGFMAKLNPDSPKPRPNNQSEAVASPPPNGPEAPTPQRPLPEAAHKESPLDLLFQAHRAEKERVAGQTGSANSMGAATSAYSPPAASSPEATVFRAIRNNYVGPDPLQRSGGIPDAELSGTPGRPPFGPAFATPFNERIRASRGGASGSATPQSPPVQTEPAQDPVAALKEVLWGKPKAVTSENQSLQPANEGQRPADIIAMEDSLRRILNIGR